MSDHMLPDSFLDEYTYRYYRGDFIARGGFGAVFRVKSDSGLAIKIAARNGAFITEPNEVKVELEKLKRLRLLPLPPRIKLAGPVSMLTDYAGYVMYLLSDMVSFEKAFLEPTDDSAEAIKNIPKWLSGVHPMQALEILHYVKTGGLRRRLLALSKCAAILARLHGMGLVYADISDNNVFISNTMSENDQVWLIDADNLRFEDARGIAVGTPGYWAPEIEQGEDCCRLSSDVYAFAVLAYRVLSLIFPFDGEKARQESRWDSDDTEMIDLPWVDDPDDDTNRAQYGIPREWVLNPSLFKLFHQMFGPGKHDTTVRPLIFHWPETLSRAADQTLYCPGCGMSFYYDNHTRCPYCRQGVQALVVKVYDWQGTHQAQKPCWVYVREIKKNGPTPVPARLLGYSVSAEDECCIEIDIGKQETTLLPCADTIYHRWLPGARDRFVRLEPDCRHRFKIDTVQDPCFVVYAERDVSRVLVCHVMGVKVCEAQPS